MDPKEQFYRHFESQATSLQEEIANLGDISAAGGERKDATDRVLGGISRLTNEVSDASEYAPPRDQMIYGQALKALREQLNIQTRSLGPKSRFEFSPESKEAFISATNRGLAPTTAPPNADADADADAASDSDIAMQTETTDALGNLPDFAHGNNHASSTMRDYNAEMARETGTGIRKPSFSRSREVDISGHAGMHIILPATARRATSSGSVTRLRRCVLDMSAPAAEGGAAPFASLAVKDVAGSLVVAGQVAGAAHVTGVRDSVLVVNARQVRMHECDNVTVYLWCGSHPIIEDCRGIRFAPLPRNYLAPGQEGGAENQWDQVDDFNWLKAEASPNWEKLEEENSVIPRDFWTGTVKGGPLLGTEDILRKAGI
ncbi:Tubulin-specific chaperone C [Cytospora mali]|uniref:Tubulin-specific chaperone C n=1 Tax=Cytospora mali TaxID=578113 RepID=A0A194W6B3_CYTMA|nr:Tubulin-specific chaperone C [Valsa mali]